MGLRFQPRSILTVMFIIVFAYAVYEVWDMPDQAKMYPWTIGLLALVLLAWQIVREVMPSEEENSRETGVDMDFTKEEATRQGKRRALELFGWMYGFAAGLWLLGYFVAIPLMVFLFMVRHKESLTLTIAMPTAAGLMTWLLFSHLLHLPFPPGVLLELAGLD